VRIISNKNKILIRGNQNPYIEEKQTTQWAKEKSTKEEITIYKTYQLKIE
jgi:hypothetical protein